MQTPWILIPLSRGLFAKIDASDAEAVCRHKWSANAPQPGRYYAQRCGEDGKHVYLHRELTGAERGAIVDHVNGDTLDCRRDNLRIASASQNASNNGRRPRGRSGYRGVVQVESGRYRAQIKHARETILVGRFDTPVEAAHAYDQKAKELHGEFAVLNFPARVDAPSGQ